MGFFDKLKQNAAERKELKAIEKQAYEDEMAKINGSPEDQARERGKAKANKKPKEKGSFLDSMFEESGKKKSDPFQDEFDKPQKNDAFEELFGK